MKGLWAGFFGPAWHPGSWALRPDFNRSSVNKTVAWLVMSRLWAVTSDGRPSRDGFQREGGAAHTYSRAYGGRRLVCRWRRTNSTFSSDPYRSTEGVAGATAGTSLFLFMLSFICLHYWREESWSVGVLSTPCNSRYRKSAGKVCDDHAGNGSGGGGEKKNVPAAGKWPPVSCTTAAPYDAVVKWSKM